MENHSRPKNRCMFVMLYKISHELVAISKTDRLIPPVRFSRNMQHPLSHSHNQIQNVLPLNSVESFKSAVSLINYWFTRAPDKLRICVFYAMKTSKNACIIRSECTHCAYILLCKQTFQIRSVLVQSCT